jgi:hypothetical protein
MCFLLISWLLCKVKKFSNFKTWFKNFSTLNKNWVPQTTKLRFLVDVCKIQSHIKKSSFEKHTLVMLHYILVCPPSIRGKPKRSLHNLPQEKNGSKLNFIQKSLSWNHIFTRSWFYNHILIVFHCSLVCPSSTIENQKIFWMSLQEIS